MSIVPGSAVSVELVLPTSVLMLTSIGSGSWQIHGSAHRSRP
jgi:hypothetical protein